MEIDKAKDLSTATELCRQAEERLCEKTVELHPPQTEEAIQRFDQVKRRLDAKGQP